MLAAPMVTVDGTTAVAEVSDATVTDVAATPPTVTDMPTVK